MSHSIISPAILYWGTPVVLVSSENEDGSENICAISSAFWLGHRCILGFGAESKTPINILRTGQCVVNLPDDSMAHHVNLLADTTGTENVSDSKKDRGYRYVKDKWTCAELTPQNSDLVRPRRILECHEVVWLNYLEMTIRKKSRWLISRHMEALKMETRYYKTD